MAISQLYPNQRPTLNLNFARSKTLDPRITLTRNSIGTYVGSDGLIKTAADNEARFDHDPATGESLGLLIEGSRTNFAKANTAGTNAGYSNGVEDFTVTPPDGSNNSVRKTFGHTAALNAAAWSSGLRWHTVFAKPGNWGKIGFRLTVGGYDYFYFDLDASPPRVWRKLLHGSTEEPPPANSYILEEHANGWWRIGFGHSNTGYNSYYLWDYDSNGEPSNDSGWPGNQPAGSYMYVWGSQLEEGDHPSSFIPNTSTSASATRAADSPEITGTNFSSWHNQSEGTFSVTAKTTASNTYAPFFTTNLSTSQIWHHQIGLWRYEDSSGTAGKRIKVFNIKTTGGSTQIELAATSGNEVFTAAVGYGSDLVGSYNGGTAISNANLKEIQPDTLFIGSRTTNAGLNYISRLSYYPIRLTDSQLQELTR